MRRRTFNFWTIFKEANLTVFKDRKDWVKIVGGLWIVVAISTLAWPFLSFLIPYYGEYRIFFLQINSFLVSLITSLTMLMLAVRAFRYKLLGETPKYLLSFEWVKHHWILLGYGLIAITICVAPFIFSPYSASILVSGTVWMNPLDLLYTYAVGVSIGWLLSLMDEIQLLFVLPSFLLAPLMLYLLGRITFFPLIISIDGKIPIKTSWNLTRGWRWLKLLSLSIIVTLPALIALSCIVVALYFILPTVIETYFFPQILINLFVNFIFSVIYLSALASCYKQLTKP